MQKIGSCLNVKLQVLRHLEADEHEANVRDYLNLAASMIRTIINNADKNFCNYNFKIISNQGSNYEGF